MKSILGGYRKAFFVDQRGTGSLRRVWLIEEFENLSTLQNVHEKNRPTTKAYMENS